MRASSWISEGKGIAIQVCSVTTRCFYAHHFIQFTSLILSGKLRCIKIVI